MIRVVLLLTLLISSCNSSEPKQVFPKLKSGEYFSVIKQGGKPHGYLLLNVNQSDYLIKFFLTNPTQSISAKAKVDQQEKSVLTFSNSKLVNNKDIQLSASLNLKGKLKYDQQAYNFQLKTLNPKEGLEKVKDTEKETGEDIEATAPTKELKEVIALAANYLELKEASREVAKIKDQDALLLDTAPSDLLSSIKDVQQKIFSLQVKLEKQSKSLEGSLASVNRQLMLKESELLQKQLDLNESHLEQEKRELLKEVSAISDDIYILKHQLGGSL